jgi:hypothetical protein
MRLISPVVAVSGWRPPQATRRPSLLATTNTAVPSPTAAASAACALPASNPPGNRRFSSAKYCSTARVAIADRGSTARSWTVAARTSRSAVANAAVRRSPLPLRQGLEDPLGQPLRAFIQTAISRPPLLCQGHSAPAQITGIGFDQHLPAVLQGPQQPTEITRVQPKPIPKLTHCGPLDTNLEDQSGRRQRHSQPEKRLLEDADALRVRAIEVA